MNTMHLGDALLIITAIVILIGIICGGRIW